MTVRSSGYFSSPSPTNVLTVQRIRVRKPQSRPRKCSVTSRVESLLLCRPVHTKKRIRARKRGDAVYWQAWLWFWNSCSALCICEFSYGYTETPCPRMQKRELVVNIRKIQSKCLMCLGMWWNTPFLLHSGFSFYSVTTGDFFRYRYFILIRKKKKKLSQLFQKIISY